MTMAHAAILSASRVTVEITASDGGPDRPHRCVVGLEIGLPVLDHACIGYKCCGADQDGRGEWGKAAHGVNSSACAYSVSAD